MDVFIVKAGLCSFILFFILQCIVFRFLPVTQVLKGLMRTAIGGAFLNLLLTAGLILMYPPLKIPFGMMGFILTLLLSFIVYGMLVFVYIFCIFGPYETSLRMRIIREIYGAGKKGITLENLLKNYNARGMLQIRLERLLGGGDIVLKDGKYYMQQQHNMFFVVEAISNQIKRWIGPSDF